MKWLLLYHGILLMILVSSKAQDLVTIQQITLIDGTSAGLEFCWTETATEYQNAELTVLLNPGGVTQTPIPGDITDPKKCASFINDPSLTVTSGDDLAFALRLFINAAHTKPAPDAEGFVTMTWQEVTSCESADSISTTNNVFRFQCNAEITDSSHKLSVDGTPIDCSITSNTDFITYCFLMSAPPSLNNFKICRIVDAIINEDDTKTLDVCAAPMLINSFPGTASDVSSLLLDYTNQITTSVVNAQAGTEKFDIINYWQVLGGETKYSSVCTVDKENSLDCTTVDYSPGRKDMNVLLVGYDSASPPVLKESKTQTIKDLNLAGVFVLDQTIELRWELPDAADGIFRAHIENCMGGTGSPTFNDADVLCLASASMCYAYFINVPSGSTSCDTTIDIIETQGDDPKGLNVIKITVPSSYIRSHQRDLEIHNVQVAWHQTEAEARANICFNHKNNDADIQFSHYEFVMVNNKGQWLKHKLMTQDTAGDICFSTFFVNTEIFDVSEGATLLVTQRALDGFTVLAGGETHMLFNRDL